MTLSITSIIILSIIAIYLIIVLFSIFVITQQKTSKILTMFGKYYKSTKYGLSMKPPWPFVVQRKTMDLAIHEIKDRVTIKSSDNAFLSLPWSLQYRVIPSKVKEAYYELDDPVDQMTSYMLNTLRGQASQITMSELFKSNESFEQVAQELLSEKFAKYGYEIVNVLVDDPMPSDEVRASFDRVIASLREKEAAVNIAESLKIKMVGEAKAEGESLKIKGEAFKKFRQDIAEGNSEAIELMLKDLPDQSIRSIDVLEFFAGVDLRDAIRDASKGAGNLVVIPGDFKNNLTLPIDR